MNITRPSGRQQIDEERRRQFESEGYNPKHDDQHQEGELHQAALVYLETARQGEKFIKDRAAILWPWEPKWFKPYKPGTRTIDKERCLVKAGALLRAEEERMERLRIVIANEIDVLNDNFIVEVIYAFKAGEISTSYFRVEREGKEWWQCKLYLDRRNVIRELEVYLKNSGRPHYFQFKDLRDQLAQADYWLKPVKKKFPRMPYWVVEMAWGIDVELHPRGKQEGARPGSLINIIEKVEKFYAECLHGKKVQ